MSQMWGDAALGARARRLLGTRHRVAAVAAVSGREIRIAGWGADPAAEFEIGSIAKGITGLLYRDAVERGVLQGRTTLGELLPMPGSAPAAGVELEAISKHRSGLPRLPRLRERRRATLGWWLRGANPYGESLADLIEQAARVQLGPPRPCYSNLGFELLGHALAAAAGLGFPDLVRERIAGPLGLKSWSMPSCPSELSPAALIGSSRSGRSREPWTGQALAPAGGIRSTVADLAELTRSLLEERVPGASAMDPVASFGGPMRIGAAWLTVERAGRAVTWHNGGTGGFRSWLGMDREAGAGVVVLSATAAPVDDPGFRLLNEM